MSFEWVDYSIDEIKKDAPGSIAIGPFGSRMKSDCYIASGVSVVRGTNLTSGREFSGDFVFISEEKAEELGGANLLPSDLVFPHRGAIGEVGIVPADGKRYVLSSSLMKLRCDEEKANPSFLYYFFKSNKGRAELLKNTSQVGTPGIGQPLASLKSIHLRLPDVAEQQRVVDVLAALDDRIALLRETNATLEAIAQALFKSWFVDFDPVKAKMEGREPEGMDEATAALFPDGFEESELGPIPRGWRVGTLADLSRLNALSWTTKKHPDVVAYIDLANAKENEIQSVHEFLFEDAPSRAKRLLRDGDTIVGTVRPGNRSFAFIHNAPLNLTGSTGFAVLSPRSHADTAFVYLAATADSSIEHLAHIADGGAYPAVKPEAVASIACVVPNEVCKQAFNILTLPLLQKIVENQQQAKILADLRDTLLPRLISGQLRLPEAEAMIEAI